MRNFIVLFFSVFCQVCFSQTGYIRQIADSNNVNVFGNIGFVDQDDNFLYVCVNTTYDTILGSSGSNGQNFIFKIDKLTGVTINSFNLNSSSILTQINDGFYHNNAIYFAGKNYNSSLLSKGSLISKYNLVTNQIEWTNGVLNVNQSSYGITSLKYNKVDKRIYFCGNDKKYINGSIPGFTIGYIDTLGLNLKGDYQGYTEFAPSNNPCCQDTVLTLINPSIELLNSANKVIVSLNDVNNRFNTTAAFFFYSNPVFPSYCSASGFGNSVSASINSNPHFCKPINNRLIRVTNSSNGFNCFMSDTNGYQIHKVSKINNLNLKDATSSNNRLFITCVDSSSSFYTNSLINLEMDTSLNVINSKKVVIDSLYQSSISVKSLFDSNSNSLYNVYTKKGVNDNRLYIHKTSFNNLNCNEFPVSVTSSTFIPAINAYSMQPVDTITKLSVSITRQSKGFTNNDACFSITNIEKKQTPNNDLLLKTLLNNEFQINSPSYIINQVVVYDMLGKKILSNELKDYNSIINLQSYTNGLYFINIKCSNGKETTFKVIKGD